MVLRLTLKQLDRSDLMFACTATAEQLRPSLSCTVNLERAVEAGPQDNLTDCETKMETRNPLLFPAELLRAGSSGQEALEWWLVHTKPRQEKKFAEEMRSWGIAHYVPVTYCKSVTRGRDRYAWLPLFSGYAFLKCNSDQRLLALKTNRLVTIHPVSDPFLLERQLATLADLIDKGIPLRVEERLVAGREVEVKAGTLKGKRGIVIRRGGKTRLFVAIAELLGGVSLELEIEQHLVEPY
jgi:transcription antitermination factor NusG